MGEIHVDLASQLYILIPDSANSRYAGAPNSEVTRKGQWLKQRESLKEPALLSLLWERKQIPYDGNNNDNKDGDSAAMVRHGTGHRPSSQSTEAGPCDVGV